MTRKKKPTGAELNAYLDGELAPGRREEVEAWLAAHPGEADRLAALRRADEALRAHYAPVADEPLPSPIQAQLAAKTPRGPVPGWLQAAAAILLFVAGAAAGFLARDYASVPDRERAALVSGAVGAHTVYVPEVRHPVEVGAEEEQHLVAWLTKRLGADVRAPVLTGDNFRLMGGRLLAHEGTPAAQFMYQDDRNRRLTLFVRQAGRAENTAFQFARQDGILAFYWIDRPLAYALVGELPRAELLPLARKVYQQLD